MNKDIELVLREIEKLQGEAVKLLQELIAINSVGPKNDGLGEGEKARFLTEYLEKTGFDDVANYPAPDAMVKEGERPNLMARLKGKNTDRTLWIMSHTDVVPPGDMNKWDTDPFKPVLKEGKIFGRGSEDNLQGLVSSVFLNLVFATVSARLRFGEEFLKFLRLLS